MTKKKTKAAPAAEAPPPAVKLQGSLEVPAGLGFRASIEDDTLQLEQDRADGTGELYTHQVSLSRIEAGRLIDFISKIVEDTEPA